MKFIYYPLILFSLWPLLSQAQKVESKESFSYSEVKELIVLGRFCQVNIEGTSEKSLRFEGEISGKKEFGAYKIEHRFENQSLKVWISNLGQSNGYSSGGDWEDLKNFRFSRLVGQLNFKVPAGVKIKVKTSSGGLKAYDLRPDSLKLISSSGTIRASKIQGDAQLKSSSGRVYLENSVGNYLARSSSGTQHWENIKGHIKTRVSSGRLLFSNIKGNLQAKASSGTIHLDAVKGKMEVRTSSGRIIGKEVELIEDSKFSAASGSIKIDFANDLEHLSFKTKAGSGNIKVGSGKKYDRYQDSEGSIVVRAETRSGRQRYK